MDYMNTGVTLQLNKAATAVEQSFADGRNGQTYERKTLQQEKKEEDKELSAEQKLVNLSISLEGLQKMKQQEVLVNREEMVTEEELESMKKRMEGLSSQVINGNFTMADRIRFQTEIKFLSDELVRVNNGGVSFTKSDNSEISTRIEELSKEIMNSAVCHRPVSAYYMMSKQQKSYSSKSAFNIAI